MASQYNLREVPAEIIVNNKNVEMIRRRQEFEDLVVNFNWFDGSDQLSSFVDWNDRRSCILFGDGAGALAIEATNEFDNF